jgi:asparagine synthase (glutamine-hydrolysing)
VDSLGLAQRLAYGHGLAGRTIWENIRLLPPAGMAVVDPARRMAHVQTIYAYDFGAKDSFLPIEAHVDRLADLFVQACRVRAMVPGPHVLSLSGGMDSRTVAAGLTRAGAAFHGRTFAKAGYTTDREAELAQRVAQTLNRPWKLVQVPGMTARAAHDLLIWRGGRNVLWMSFILAFYQALRDEFGPGVVGYTGDGGDFALPDMRPARTILSLEGLGDYIGDYGYITNYCLKTEDAAKLAGIPLEKLTHSVLDHLKIYPMDQWNTAFIHYIFVDNIPHIYHEGLDRNRMFFWHTSPFFAPAFLGAALRVPWPMKAGYRLYQKVLERLSPEAARIEYGNHPLGSLSFRWHYFQYRLKKGHPRLAKWLKHRIKGEDVYAENSDLVRIVRHQIQSRPSLAGAMDAPFLKKLVHPSAMYNKFNVLSLFTVVADLEEGLSGHSMLEEEADAVLL